MTATAHPATPRMPGHGSAARVSALARGPDRERGSATLELVLLAPALLVVVGVVIAAGRVEVASAAVEHAAAEAARSASLTRTVPAAAAAAETAGRRELTGQVLDVPAAMGGGAPVVTAEAVTAAQRFLTAAGVSGTATPTAGDAR